MNGPNEITMQISGMTCSDCEGHVVDALRGVPGVAGASASFADGMAEVEVSGAVDLDALESAIRTAGYSGSVTRRPEVEAPAIVGSGEYEFDVAVIGGGSAGFAAALRATDLGARVALINAGTIGGTCVNVGCVPSKTLIRAAEAQHRRTHHPFAGVPQSNGAVDWETIRGQKDELVAQLRQAKYRDVLAGKPGVRLFEARAHVQDARRIALNDGSSLHAEKTIITTGSAPSVASIPGLEEAGYLTNETAMALDALPESLTIIGGGFIAVELGQTFHRLGTRVTLLVRGPHVLREEDPAIGVALTEYLRGEGIQVVTGVSTDRIDRAEGQPVAHIREAGGAQRDVRSEHILVATGRRANSTGFGLAEVGVTIDENDAIQVDRYLRTTNPDIYAAGDVTGDPMFVYVAAYSGSLAAENALTDNTKPRDLTTVPRVIFSDPSVAAVGLTEAEARSQGIDPIVSTLPLEHVPRSLAARDTRGFVKLVADRKTRRIVGAHILASEAGEMIMEPTLAVRFGLTIEDLTSTLHPYLTLSEGIKLAAQTFDKNVAELSCCAA